MAVTITMPQLGETVTEGTILSLANPVGDTIAEDERPERRAIGGVGAGEHEMEIAEVLDVEAVDAVGALCP